MKHIPLLFSTTMAAQNIEYLKNQTCRLKGLDGINEDPGRYKSYGIDVNGDRAGSTSIKGSALFEDLRPEITPWIAPIKCPYGQPGDIFWQRETHFKNGDEYIYLADGTCCEQFEQCECYDVGKPKWVPGIHMKKEAARFWGEITGITIQRIADITEAEAIEEGVEKIPNTDFFKKYGTKNDWVANARASFAYLWDSINGRPSPVQTKIGGKMKTISYIAYLFDDKISYKLLLAYKGVTKNITGRLSLLYRGLPLVIIVNPWVWVIKYKPCEQPADFI